MSFLLKPPNKTLHSLSILTSTFRHFTAQSSAATANPFPDDPTSAYYDDQVAAAGRAGDLDALRDLLNKRVQDGCFNTKRTFKFLTATDTATIDDLVRTLSNLNTGFTRKSAFDSLVTRLCHLRRFDDSLRVVEAMARDADCALTACTFYPILNLLTREKSMGDARRVVDLMARLGVRPDLTVHNFFLSAHCFEGNLAAAAAVLREIEVEGLVADARTFDALVMGACRAGKVEGAMMLVRRMVGDGVPMLYSTHMFVIGALLKRKCFEQAVKYVRSFGGKDKALDAMIYGCLGSKLVRLKMFKEAMKVLEDMKQMGLPMGDKLRKFYEKNVGK